MQLYHNRAGAVVAVIRFIPLYRKSGNFGHGFILAPKYEMPKLNTPKYVTLQKLTAKIEHCLNIFVLHGFYQCTLFTCNFSLVIQANDFTS
jgi:hypothetical protein